MDKQIMGKDISELLTIKNGMREGRIQFFTLICILLVCALLYELAIIIWSVKKTQTLMDLKQELYKKHRSRGKKNNLHAPAKHKNTVELKEKSSMPMDSDIEDAMGKLNDFHRKGYL